MLELLALLLVQTPSRLSQEVEDSAASVNRPQGSCDQSLKVAFFLVSTSETLNAHWVYHRMLYKSYHIIVDLTNLFDTS